ncbi:hypothetical protein DB346_10060 [Verrucomicrobia bacterium LW23]|nr:hypothetical protein DB346_10060 [Verrucomicrobia bacterium LW23]
MLTHELSILLKIPRDFNDPHFCGILREIQSKLDEASILYIRGHITNGNETEQILLVDILGQNFVQHKNFHSACVEILTSLLNDASSSKLLTAVIYALGQLGTPVRCQCLLPFCQHPDSAVRTAVGWSLGGCESEDAVKSQIHLSKDIDAEVRDIATFGLGSLISNNTSEIRDALFLRMSDENPDVRFEAIVGLISRQDSRCLEHIQPSSFTEFQRRELLDAIPEEASDERWTRTKEQLSDSLS